MAKAVNAEQAGRIAGLKKGDMAEAAERLVEGRGWLPPVLRILGTADEAGSDPQAADVTAVEPTQEDAYPFAAE